MVLGMIPGKGKIFLFSKMSRVALGTTQPPIQWVPWTLSLWVKWLGYEANHSPTPTAQVISAVIPLLSPHGAHGGKFSFHFSSATLQLKTFYRGIILHTSLTQMFIYKGVSASDSDINCYVIVRKLLLSTLLLFLHARETQTQWVHTSVRTTFHHKSSFLSKFSWGTSKTAGHATATIIKEIEVTGN